MDEYIKREAVIKVLTDRYELVSDTDMSNTIKSIPAEDVRKNVHGYWKRGTLILNRSVCSVCGWRIDDAPTDEYKFCPNCGASMRKCGENYE